MWLKMVNICRISAGVRAKFLMFVVTDNFSARNCANFFTGYIITVRAEL